MRILRGIVTSTKMTKTATVSVERFYLHPRFKKKIQSRKKYHVANEIGAKEGQRVEIKQGRPLSRTKKWSIVKII